MGSSSALMALLSQAGVGVDDLKNDPEVAAEMHSAANPQLPAGPAGIGSPQPDPVAPMGAPDSMAAPLGQALKLTQASLDAPADSAVEEKKLNAKATTHDLEAGKIKRDQEVKQADALKPYADEAMSQLDNLDQEMARITKASRAERDQEHDKYLRTVDDYKQTKVYSWWGHATTGAKILGVISQALAGAAQGLYGQSGPTPLDRIIDEDMAVQKMNLAQKGEVVAQQRSLWNDLNAQFKDEVVTNQAFRSIAYESVLTRAKTWAMQNQKDGAMAQYQILEQNLRARQAQGNMEIQKHLGDKTLQANMNASGTLVQIAGLLNTADNQEQVNQLSREKANAERQKTGLAHIEGSELLPPETKNKLGDFTGSGEGLIKALEDYKKAVKGVETVTLADGKKVAKESTNPEDRRKKLEQMRDDILIQSKLFNQFGAALAANEQAAAQGSTATDNDPFTLGLKNMLSLGSEKGLDQRLDLAASQIKSRVRSKIGAFSDVNGQPLRFAKTSIYFDGAK